MTILDRLDGTIKIAQDAGAEITEIDLTDEDYAELMVFASAFDDAALEQMMLDMSAKTYKHYPLRYRSNVSHAEVENGESVMLVEVENTGQV